MWGRGKDGAVSLSSQSNTTQRALSHTTANPNQRKNKGGGAAAQMLNPNSKTALL